MHMLCRNYGIVWNYIDVYVVSWSWHNMELQITSNVQLCESAYLEEYYLHKQNVARINELDELLFNFKAEQETKRIKYLAQEKLLQYHLITTNLKETQ